jgi:hypothetical protein
MSHPIPEKAKLLKKLKEAGFAVPDFIYVPADHFENDDTAALEAFLAKHRESFKVIARSAHPQERCFKGGTFDSLETYADVSGIRYARNKMIKLAETTKRLTILRQQKFGHAPELDMNEMGVVVMPFVDGTSVMAKQIFGHWEFGYCRDRVHRIQSEPYITRTPHDRRLVQLSKKIQECLKFRCEIEYIISGDGEIHVVQAKDISNIDTLEEVESRRSITLDRHPADSQAAQLPGTPGLRDGQQILLYQYHQPMRGDAGALCPTRQRGCGADHRCHQSLRGGLRIICPAPSALRGAGPFHSGYGRSLPDCQPLLGRYPGTTG